MNSLSQFQEQFHQHVLDLQDQITDKMNQVDSNLELNEDLWERTDYEGKPGGGGRTRSFSGKIFENAGVNVSNVFGAIDPNFAKEIGGTNNQMWASGISLILHPVNPKVPTVHANFRMICAGEKFWFGGGADLTPYYPYEEDFQYFHDVWKNACEPYGAHQEMKEYCDRYFVNKHRDNEMRGVGGIFFDHHNTGNLKEDFDMVVHLSQQFMNSYFPILEKRVNESYSEEDVDFQLHRRGRYVEFNLLHDRGTLFGLRTNGRTDSILISLPGRCKYSYKYAPKEGSAHEKMMEYYKPRDW